VTVFVAPIYWLTGNGVLAHNVAILGSFVVAAVSMYILARELVGRRDAAIIAAVAFAFCPYRVGGEVARLQMMMAAWLPLALWAVHRYARQGRRRHLAVAVGAILLLVLSNMYLLYYALPTIVLVAAHGRSRSRQPPAVRWRDVALATTAITLILAPIGAHYLRVKRDLHFARSNTEIGRYSADVRSYASVWQTSPLAGWLPVEITADRALFPGLVLLTLAAVACAPRRRPCVPAMRTERPAGPGRWRRFVARALPCGVVPLYGLVAVAAFLCSLGPWPTIGGHGVGLPGPYAALMAVLPGMDGLRAPSRFGIIVMVALAVLAAAGARRLLVGRSTIVRVGLVTAVIVAVVMEGYGGPTPLVRFSRMHEADSAAAYAWLAEQPPGAVLELPFSGLEAQGAQHPALAYQYATLIHRHPLVNGSSGFTPPLARVLESPLSPLRHPGALAQWVPGAQRLGVRYVIVHEADYSRPALAAGVTKALRHSPAAIEVLRFGRVTTIVLAPSATLTPALRTAAR
jgi:4-amino-4-deoxy-L-arabinose transferase-like glycosyltransferase